MTPREVRCVCAAADGLTALESAGELGVSKYTVDDALKAARGRVGAKTTVELIALLAWPLRDAA